MPDGVEEKAFTVNGDGSLREDVCLVLEKYGRRENVVGICDHDGRKRNESVC